MSEQSNATAKSFFDAWNDGDLDAYDAIMTTDGVTHDAQDPFANINGPEGAKKLAEMYRSAFPDTHFAIEEQIGEGDFVAVRWTATGTNDGELMGMPPNGKKVDLTGMSIFRFEDGKIAEGWSNWDTLGMLQQLGVVPVAAPASA